MTPNEYVINEINNLFNKFPITACKYEVSENVDCDIHFICVIPTHVANTEEFAKHHYKVSTDFQERYITHIMCIIDEDEVSMFMHEPETFINNHINSEQQTQELLIAS